jgi:acyl transferase domain-containing protein/acyl carrier protein
MAGLFKIVLALQHQELPPTLHVKQLNTHIPWEKIGITVPTTLTPWLAQGDLRIAGLSAFGLSGSNAHLIIEEAPRLEKKTRRQGDRETRSVSSQLFTLSAKSAEALRDYARHYVGFLSEQPAINLGDLCYTAQIGRNHFDYRLAISGTSATQLQSKLNAYIQNQDSADISRGIASIEPKASKSDVRRVAFLFTGQGSQYVGMGCELYETQPIFRAIIDRCDVVAQTALGRSLIELIYPAAQPTHNDLMESHPCGQAANFAIECALAELWHSWGIEPGWVLGHSLGDFAAAYTAGVLSLEEGVRLVVTRGQLMERARGSMVSVLASEQEVLPYLAPFADVTIGVINGPRSVVVSGGYASVAQVVEQLQQAGFKTRKLDIPVAAHSPLLDAVLDEFESAVRQVKLGAPRCQVISSMTGQPVTTELSDPGYWRQHLRNTVRFADGVQTLHEQGARILLEIGPKPTLLGIAEQCLDSQIEKNDSFLALPSLRAGQSDWEQMLASLGALYCQGVEINWDALDREDARRKIALPTYPFQRQSYWLDFSKTRLRRGTGTGAQALGPLVERMLQLPKQKQTVFENAYSIETLPFLADHKVFGTVVSPGACQLAMVLSCANLGWSTSQVELTDVVLPQALVLATGTRTAQVIVTALEADKDKREFTLQSFDSANIEAEPPTHAVGYLSTQPAPPSSIDLVELRKRFGDDALVRNSFSPSAHIELGPSFQWITKLWRREHDGQVEILGQLQLPAVIAKHPIGIERFDDYLLHPGLLDACFQVAGSAATDGSQTMLPFALKSLRFYKPGTATMSREWWCYATQVATNQYDVTLFNPSGQVLVSVDKFQVRQASPEAVRGQDIWRDWLYQIEWQPLADDRRQTTDDREQTWLIFADAAGLGEAVARQLRAQGASATLVYPGETWHQVAPEQFVINPHRAEDYEQLMTAVPPLNQVVHLWSLDIPTLDAELDLPRATQPGWESALNLVQAVLKRQTKSTRLWLVTQNAQLVAAGDKVCGVAQTPLWGLGQVILQEYPELDCHLIDLDEGTRADQTEQARLLCATMTNSAETAFAIRRQTQGASCYVARLARAIVKETRPITISNQATYLITGGLGGVGFEIARWFAEQGAGHLVLVGRSAPRAEIQTQIEQLRALGVQITIAQADVTKRAQVAALLANIDARFPLRGVIHAAAVLDDGTLLQQNQERFDKVLAPKMQGAWHLHELTQANTLDLFVMFSSVAGLVGRGGQSNYAAANAFLDGLAHYRQARQQPGLSINWGAWSQVGLAANLASAQQEQMRNQGLGFMTPQQGVAAFAALVQQPAPQIAVLPITWKQYVQSVGALPPFYAEFAERVTPPATRESPQITFRQNLQAAQPSEHKALLIAHIQETVAHILGMPNAPAARVGFFELGMDSLMALELRRRLERNLQIVLPATVAFEYPTAERLAEYLLAEALVLNGVEGLSDLAEGKSNLEQNQTTELAALPKVEAEPASATKDTPSTTLRAGLEQELNKLESLLKE